MPALSRPKYAMPDFVHNALIERHLLGTFHERPAYQQNDYIGWIARAKRVDTQMKRLNQMLEELTSGDSYMKMSYQPPKLDHPANSTNPDGDEGMNVGDSRPVSVWEMSDLRTPWCLFVVATLNIAEHISAGKHTIEELARAAECDPHMLNLILGHLVSKGVFLQPTPGTFELNDAARQLLDPITKISLNLEDIGGRFAQAWSTLLQVTRTGQPAYNQLFGLPFWEDLSAHPNLSSSFDAIIGPPGHGIPDPDFQVTGGWDDIHTIVDVGGGTGAMLAEILRLRPNLRGILVDQPATLSRSTGIFQAAGVTDRVTTIGQSFFDPLPRGADLYVLRGILNDWPDREVLKILRRCADAARPSGKIVVLKSVDPDGTPMDITIETVLLGGRHRTLSEFKQLAHDAGMQVIAANRQPSEYFVVECQPVMGPSN